MKKVFFYFLFVCSFAIVTVSCHQDDELVKTSLADENSADVAMKYTSCATIGSTPNYTTTDVPFATWRSYVMASNKLLRVRYTGPIDHSKKMSFTTAAPSGSVKARMYAKTNTNNIIAMSQCITVTSSSTVITSVTNVPLGSTEVWLEFSSDAAVTAQYLRQAQHP